MIHDVLLFLGDSFMNFKEVGNGHERLTMRTQFNGARKQKTTDQHWASDSGVRPTFSVLCTRKNLRKQFLSRQFLLPADLTDRQTKQMAFQLCELLRAFGMTVVWEGKGSGIGAFVTV